MIHWLSKSIFLKKEKKRSQAVTQRCQKYKHNPPFLIERPLHHSVSELSRQVSVTSLALEWRSCNHARPFSFVPPLSFTKLELFGFHLLRNHDHSDFAKQRISLKCCAELREKKGQLEKIACPSSYYTERLFSLTVRSR